MGKVLTPGQNSGSGGGIFQQVGPRGGKVSNFVAVPDNKPMPPTTKPNSGWTQVHRTPNNKH